MASVLEHLQTKKLTSLVTLTDTAKEYLTAVTDSDNKKYVHLTVNGGGCSGFQYKIDFDDAVHDDDSIFETDGVKLLVDETSMEFMEGAEVDFVEELIGAAFKINNPNATASCGCGTSFSVF